MLIQRLPMKQTVISTQGGFAFLFTFSSHLTLISFLEVRTMERIQRRTIMPPILETPTPSSASSKRIAASKIFSSTIRPSRATWSDLNYQWCSLVSLLFITHFLTACGYNLTDGRILQLNQFLDEKSAQKVDLPLLLMTLTYLKELEL